MFTKEYIDGKSERGRAREKKKEKLNKQGRVCAEFEDGKLIEMSNT